MTDLLDAYSGKLATRYDRRRKRTRRWRAEVASFEAMLSTSQATCVLDCPFGTGRWLPQYVRREMSVVGVDLSFDMLSEAEKKIEALPQNVVQISLLRRSIFDLTPAEMTQQPDLIVCVRFLNWIAPEAVERALATFSAFQAKEMIIGASVVPMEAGRSARFVYRTSLERINSRRPDGPKQYVHDERWLLSSLDAHGWKVISKTKTMRRISRVNFMYLLIRR